MNNIFFKTISFKQESYSYAYVDGSTLNIVLNGVDVPVHFKTHEDAIDGAKELNDILNGTRKAQKTSDIDILIDKIKSGEVLTILENCNDKLNEAISGAYSTIEQRLNDQSFKDIAKKAEERVEGVINDIDAVLTHMFTKPYETSKDETEEPVEKAKPTIITKVKRSFGSLDDVFGFSKENSSTEEPVPEVTDILIGDMTTTQLKKEISLFVDGLLNSERAESMFNSISSNFGKEATEQAVQAFKDLIYTVAISNPDKTLEQVLRENFK